MRMPWEITREMFLEFDQVQALLAHIRAGAGRSPGRAATLALLDRVVIETPLFSGIRSSELCNLRLADVALATDEPTILVRGQRKEDRTVFIPNPLAELLSTFITHVRPQLLPDDVRPRDPARPLLYNEHRQPYERTGLYRRVVRILTEAGLGDRASVQLLRHTYGYLAYARTGGNLLFVQRQLGHAHPVVTSIYAQFVQESYPDMADMAADPARPPGGRVTRQSAINPKGAIVAWKQRRLFRKPSKK